MIVNLVHVNVREDFIEDFILETGINHRESLKEPGNLRFDILQDAEEPRRFTLYEMYESEESAADHKKTAHYKRWRTAVEPWMLEPRKGIRYDVIFPKEVDK